jgi:hypothetical protein
MPASNFPFRAPFGCKLQEVSHNTEGETKKENWLVVEPNTEEGLSDKQKPYCFTADADTRESSIFFNFAIGKIVGNDYYLLASINGDSQQSFEIKNQKKDGEKWVEDVDKTKEFYKQWKETGYLVAYHCNGIWNLELLVKALVEHKVMIKENIKCLFSKKEIPLELLAKVSDQYNAAIGHLKTGEPPKNADPEIFLKLKALNSSMGLPSLVLKDVELEDDFGEQAACPMFKGELPDNVEALFDPKPATPRKAAATKNEGLTPEQRMDFLFNNIDKPELDTYVNKILSTNNGLIKHIILCQITGLNVQLPVSRLSQNTGISENNLVLPIADESDANNSNGYKLKNGHPPIENVVDDYSDQLDTSTVDSIEETFYWGNYLESSTLTPKEKKKITECLEECLKHTYINWTLYVKGMEVDCSTTLQKNRRDPEVINLVCKTIIVLYKIVTSETLIKNLTQLPNYLNSHYCHTQIEFLTFSQLKDLQLKLSELDSRASLEEVSLAV